MENGQMLETFRLTDELPYRRWCEAGLVEFVQMLAKARNARNRGVVEEAAAVQFPDFEAVVQSWKNTVL
jgi:hypothetical protein